MGFEPTSRLLVNTLSKRAPSATRTPLPGFAPRAHSGLNFPEHNSDMRQPHQYSIAWAERLDEVQGAQEKRSFEAAAEAEFEAKDAVLVANAEDRDVIADVPFKLNDAVLGVGGVRDVSEGQVMGDLLFDRNAGA